MLDDYRFAIEEIYEMKGKSSHNVLCLFYTWSWEPSHCWKMFVAPFICTDVGFVGEKKWMWTRLLHREFVDDTEIAVLLAGWNIAACKVSCPCIYNSHLIGVR